MSTGFETRLVAAGTRVVAAGAMPDGLYVPLSGAFRVVSGGDVVGEVCPGDLRIPGYGPLSEGHPADLDVVANVDMAVLWLSSPSFAELVAQYPDAFSRFEANRRRLTCV